MSRRYQAAILTASYNGLQVPNAPTIGTATAGSGTASVTFTAPSNVGGSAITSYTVISSPGGITGTGASSPVTVSGLTNGTAYTFTVVATNAYGSGPASAASNSVTPAVNYIENVFSTWLYTGNGSTQTITNGIDLSTNGGMVWIKCRTPTAYNNWLSDTVRGNTKRSSSNTTSAESTLSTSITSFNSNGFSIGSNSNVNDNGANETYVSWTFREQPKFFDVVTYTGTGSNTTIAHNLGAVPGCIIVKRTDTTAAWAVYHRSLANTQYLVLNTTAAAATGATWWNSTTPTSTVFSVGTDASVNASGGTYVAYIFAHDAGGFGLTGTDNVISCGSFTSNSSGGISPVNLGFEPQWLLVKNTSADGWRIQDVMRGWSQTQLQDLSPNGSEAERALNNNPSYLSPTATGFSTPTPGIFTANNTFIYVAIRRGPMAVPTVGTSVFSPNATTAVDNTKITTGFPVDLQIQGYRAGLSVNQSTVDRLRGVGTTSSTTTSTPRLSTSSTAAEATATVTNGWDNTGFQISSGWDGNNMIYWNFKRAPGFFDEVCFDANGSSSGQNVNHNLGVVPELMIVRIRTGTEQQWRVYVSSLGNTKAATLNIANAPFTNSIYWNNTSPTASVFTVGSAFTNDTRPVVAYLFATAAGVSKVGSYTGTGALQTINCAFTTGARFVLIKRTDDTGDWYTYDSARGITSGNDPYLLMNSTAAETTGTNYVDSTAAGFQVTAAAPADLNAAGGTYIFLAIA